MKKWCRKILCVVLLILLGFGTGMLTYRIILTGRYLPGGQLSVKSVAALNEAYRLVSKDALEEYSEEELTAAALKGMASCLRDNYAYYYTAEELDSYQKRADGVVTAGIGISLLDYQDGVYIQQVYAGLPGEAAGFRTGDRLLAIDGQSIEGINAAKAGEWLKGDSGTGVTLTVERDNVTFDIYAVRSDGQRQMTTYRMLDNNLLLITISSFHGNCAEYFAKAVEYARQSQCSGLIIDLRNNLGGSVDLFEKIADIMLPEGETFYALNADGKKTLSCKSDEDCFDIPMVVLVNGTTASAAEALAGALRDMGGAVLVGTQTYGKGILQTTYSLSNGGAFKMTTAKYYIPSGVCIQGVGLTPDYAVEPAEKDVPWIPEEKADLQLQKAILLLTKS